MTKKKIILIGCGEHARMVIDNLEDQGLYELFGLTTHTAEELDKKVCGYTVVCKDEDIPRLISENPDIAGYVLGVGNMQVRHRLYTVLDPMLAAVNIIHPSSMISKRATLGTGNLIEAFTKIANGAKIGNHCILNSFSAVNHDQILGDNVLIAGNVSMAGRKIGSHTIIADGASIGFKKSVGAHCIVGDGAVVTKDLPDHVIAYGNPARIVRKNGSFDV
ncbi:MAG: NeuD/PglB/VioB family sugar acetyltransferase [Candidatus Omnitrophota bacterium]|jgi:sugar O-acyltransferase (sialic acid O-acetyltransferase NeuD family)